MIAMIENAAALRESMTIELPTGARTDIKALWRDSGSVAALLSRRHPVDSHVACVLTSTIESLRFLLGAWRAGLHVVSLPPRWANASCVEDAEHARLLALLEVRETFSDNASVAEPLLQASSPFPDLDSSTSCPHAEPGSLIQFTSGSTGEPRPVRVSQHALSHNISALLEVIQPRPGDVAYSWLPLSHDMGLIGMLLASLVAGCERWTNGRGSLVLRHPEQFARRPSSWIEDCARYGVSVTAVPPFALELAADVRGEFDLSNLRCCIVGGDSIRSHHLRSVSEAHAANGLNAAALCPGYGLAEATLGVTLHSPDEPWEMVRSPEDGREFVSCGHPLQDMDVLVTPSQEILVTSPSLATPATPGQDPGRMSPLNTGDLGFLDRTGQLAVVGRNTDRIVVNGRTLSPSEIEVFAPQHGFDAGNVAAVQVTDGELIVVVVDRAGVGDADAFRSAVLHSLGVRVDRVLTIDLPSLPRTSSGKVRREEVRRRITEGGQ